MALKATIYRAELVVSDMDRNYYHTHVLTIARHPSETGIRMMMRLLAFALHAHEDLAFTRGLSSDEEPDLWQKNPGGEIELWIDLGQPDERRIRKACGRAARVLIYTYQARSARVWWEQIHDRLQRFRNLEVVTIDDRSAAALGELAQRNMQLQCSIQDGQVWLGDGKHNLQLQPQIRKTCE